MACPACAQRQAEEPGLIRTVLRYLWLKLFDRKVSKDLAERRLAVCRGCAEVEVDDNGKRTDTLLFRTFDGKMYCGAPRTSKIVRFETRKGCGCDLADKVRYKSAMCPHQRWGPDEYFGHTTLTVFPQTRVNPRMIDVFQKSRESFFSNLGIGDAISFACIMPEIMKSYPGYVARLRAPLWLLPWATLFWEDVAPQHISDVWGDGEIILWPCEEGWDATDSAAIKMGMNRHQYWMHRCGVKNPPRHSTARPLLTMTDLQWAVNVLDPVLQKASVKKTIILAPYASSATKSYPKEHWLWLEEHLTAMGYAVVVIGSSGQANEFCCFKSTKFMGLEPRLLTALLSAAYCVVSNDSSAAHIAGALNRPTIALCGPTNGHVIYDFYQSVKVIQARGNCVSCNFIPNRGYDWSCRESCRHLSDIPPEIVLGEVLQNLAKENSHEELRTLVGSDAVGNDDVAHADGDRTGSRSDHFSE